MTNTSRRWIWLIVLLGIVWASAEVRYWRLRNRLSSLWVVATTVRAVDESSGAVLPIGVGDIPGRSSEHDYLPWSSVTAVPDGNLRITVASDEPLTLQVSSEGYSAQPLTIDHASNLTTTVKLRKK